MNLVAKSWKLLVKPKNNFHELLCWTLREPSEAIVPEIMVIMEAIDFANSLHEFGSKNHGNYW